MTGVLLLFQLHLVLAEEAPISLAGTWRFQLDPKGAGVAETWFSKHLDDTVQLPGTTDENHKGIQQDERPTDRLARPWFWKGAAWYQREVNIPASWAGKHTITVLIDNSKLPPVGPAHQVDERSQTNWNGIVGAMELRASDPVWIKDAQVYPNAAKMEARVRVIVANATGKPAEGTITVNCESANVCEVEKFTTQSVRINAGGSSFTDKRTVTFGMRDFTAKGSLLVCSIDLPAIQDKPEARQMLHSLLQYAASSNFAPKTELPGDLLETLLP